MFSVRALLPFSPGRQFILQAHKTSFCPRYLRKPYSASPAIGRNELGNTETTEVRIGEEEKLVAHNINSLKRLMNGTKDSAFLDDTNSVKRRRPKWTTSYSKMTIEETERRLRIRIDEIRAVPVNVMVTDSTTILENAGIDKKMIDIIKDDVYYHILQYLDIEGYPTDASSDFKEANVSDLVLYTIGPIISSLKRFGRKLLLKREKEIISVDGLTGGMEEFLVVDRVAITEEKSVLIIEAKRASMGQAMTQILLAMRDARDNNPGGIIYGFVTTGDDWRMLSYDGRDFVMTNKFTVLFDTMRDQKEIWLQENAIIVNCMLIALANGGIGLNIVGLEG